MYAIISPELDLSFARFDKKTVKSHSSDSVDFVMFCLSIYIRCLGTLCSVILVVSCISP